MTVTACCSACGKPLRRDEYGFLEPTCDCSTCERCGRVFLSSAEDGPRIGSTDELAAKYDPMDLGMCAACWRAIETDLTKPQREMLGQIRAAKVKVFNGRASKPLETLESKGLVILDWGTRVSTKGNGIDITWRITARIGDGRRHMICPECIDQETIGFVDGSCCRRCEGAGLVRKRTPAM